MNGAPLEQLEPADVVLGALRSDRPDSGSNQKHASSPDYKQHGVPKQNKLRIVRTMLSDQKRLTNGIIGTLQPGLTTWMLRLTNDR